jgi:CBS domain-containing protein
MLEPDFYISIHN